MKKFMLKHLLNVTAILVIAAKSSISWRTGGRAFGRIAEGLGSSQ